MRRRPDPKFQPIVLTPGGSKNYDLCLDDDRERCKVIDGLDIRNSGQHMQLHPNRGLCVGSKDEAFNAAGGYRQCQLKITKNFDAELPPRLVFVKNVTIWAATRCIKNSRCCMLAA